MVGTAAAGEGKNADVQYKAKGYLGHYSGTFSVKNTAAEFNYILLYNSDGEGYSPAQLVLDNAKVGVPGGVNGQYGKVLMNGESSIIATNDSVIDLRGHQNYGYISMGAGNSISLTDSVMYLGREGQGTNTLAGTVSLVNSKIDSLGKINSSAAITIDNTSTITATTFNGANGSVKINVAESAYGVWKVIDVTNASDFGTVTVTGANAGYWVDEAGDLWAYNTAADTIYVNAEWADIDDFAVVDKGLIKGANAFDNFAEAVSKIATDGSNTVIKLESDLTAGDIAFNYGNGNITFTADKAVTVSQNVLGSDWDFVVGDVAPTITIGKNVTFEVYDNASGLYVYYGANLNVEGTITGGGNFGCTYLGYGEHTVAATGTISTARIQLSWTTLTVNGKIDTNYLAVEDSTFTANNATVDAGIIIDAHYNGAVRYDASEFVFNKSTVTAGTVELKQADSKMSFNGGSVDVETFTNAGSVGMAGVESKIGTLNNTKQFKLKDSSLISTEVTVDDSTGK